MDQHFEHTEIVSNGFISQLDYSQTKINQLLLADGYLNCFKLGTNPAAVSSSNLIDLIVINSLTEAERECIKTDYEGDSIFIFTKLISVAEKLDHFISLIYKPALLQAIINQNLELLQPVSIEAIEAILKQPSDIVYEGQRLGQLEWLDYSQYAINCGQIKSAINSYNKYYLATGDAMACFNLAVTLSSINLDLLAVNYYQSAIKAGYDCNHNLAYSYFQLNQFERGYELVSTIDLDSSKQSYLLKAQYEIKLKKYNQALETLNQGFIATKHSNPNNAQLIKKQFISLHNYLQETRSE